MSMSDWKLLGLNDLIDFCLVDLLDAWYELDDRTRPKLLAYARGRLRHHEWPDWFYQAEVVADEVWLTRTLGPIQVLRRYNPEKDGTLPRYLRHRAWTIIRNMVRGRWLRRHIDAEVAAGHEPIAGPSEAQVVALGIRVLDEAPPAQSEVGRNRLLGTGDLTGLSEGTIRQRLHELKLSIKGSLRAVGEG